MAITRAQIAKQLLAQGGRIGLQRGGRRGDTGQASQSESRSFGGRDERPDMLGVSRAVEQKIPGMTGPAIDFIDAPVNLPLRQRNPRKLGLFNPFINKNFKVPSLITKGMQKFAGLFPNAPDFRQPVDDPGSGDSMQRLLYAQMMAQGPRTMDNVLEEDDEEEKKLEGLRLAFKANGGRIGYKEGTKDKKGIMMASAVGDESDDIAMELYGKPVKDLNPAELEDFREYLDNLRTKFMAQGGRIGYRNGNDVDPDDPLHEVEPLIIPDDADISPDDFGGRKEKPSGIMMASGKGAQYYADLYMKYAQDMMNDGITPMSIEDFVKIIKEAERTKEAQGGRIGDKIRQAYGLGSIVKKAVGAVKKVAKSPIGKAALLYFAPALIPGGASTLGGVFQNMGGLGGLKTKFLGSAGKFITQAKGTPLERRILSGASEGILGKLGLTSGFGGGLTTSGIGTAITAASLLPLLGIGTGDESEEEAQAILQGQGLDIDAIRANPNQYLARAFRAEGGSMDEPVAKKTMPLLDMGGQEMDLRAEGGFVPIGRMEKADDVPARLSKNEFVFTADAVRNAGDGNVDKGAEVMYNMMKNLEAGGDVSEESQGLEGARRMFQTSQRLEEVL